MSVIERLTAQYTWAMEDASDVRTKDWLLMPSPWPAIAIVLAYLVFVKKGPQWMENRQPVNLNSVLIAYNFGLVVLSAYMFWEFFASSVLVPGYSLQCLPVDYSQDPNAVRLASVCWWYFFSKVIELADTVFFILRKKNNQVSFLHVYHHASMVALWWIGVRWVAVGDAYFSAMLNCFIHVLMYTYYMLSAFGPHMQKYLWWKRYMTKLQLAQFVAILVHTLITIFLDCGIPAPYKWALVFYMFSHIALFSNFYYQSYIKKKRGKSEKREKENGSHVPNGIQNGYVPHGEAITRRKPQRAE